MLRKLNLNFKNDNNKNIYKTKAPPRAITGEQMEESKEHKDYKELEARIKKKTFFFISWTQFSER